LRFSFILQTPDCTFAGAGFYCFGWNYRDSRGYGFGNIICSCHMHLASTLSFFDKTDQRELLNPAAGIFCITDHPK